ncbi:MAG: hypothetical protein EBT63_01790 [Proteobacteria bacterium]|nr:hypothetical protein [Pseudomonadota bacterium]NCA28569.1 hypothetical protein [Pseudomonadota bacterium]
MLEIIKSPTKFFLKIAVIFLFNITLFSCNPKAHEGNFRSNNFFSQKKFVDGTQDIPLADGLEIIDDDGVEFDTILGSFSTVNYKSKNDKDEITKFYNLSLPKLGWEAIKTTKNSLIFQRDNQKLEIKFLLQNSQNVVIFLITAKTK